MMTETLPMDGGADGNKDPPRREGMAWDAKNQHERFRAIVKPIVELRCRCDPTFAKRDWVVQCFDSQEALESYFPDREAFEQILQDLAVRMRIIEEQVAGETERVRRVGLSYLDIERVRYMSPGMQEDKDA